MKPVNLISLIHSNKFLPSTLRDNYNTHFGHTVKSTEIDDLEAFTSEFNGLDDRTELLNDFYFNYIIPQVGKEFDLLRFGIEYNINVELKSTDTGVEILEQLIKNRYYLKFLNKRVYNYTYVSDVKILYELDDSGSIRTADIKDLIDLIQNQKLEMIADIDKLFNPSNYLVSPFNSTKRFLRGEYFLTNHQIEIKNQVNETFNKSGVRAVSVTGNAGTGKTLLTFDIAKDYLQHGKKVLVVHVGLLNQGHEELRKRGWSVIPVKILFDQNLSNFDILIVDEFQRLRKNQLAPLINEIKKTESINVIFSYDSKQCLTRTESAANIPELVNTLIDNKVYRLTDKIRTNPDLANFIKRLFNSREVLKKINNSKIELSYFHSSYESKFFMEMLADKGWKIINYTSSTIVKLPYDRYKLEDEYDNSHKVIGQEFDKVVVVIDEYLHYDTDGNLTTKYDKASFHYSPDKMLYQNITRTRQHLHVIVINNPDVFGRCIQILHNT